MSRYARLSLFALYAVMVAGCAPESTSVSGTALASAVRSDTRWRFNSQKYRDTGSHPATGRSGSAALQAEALVDASGAVNLVVTSYRASDILTTPAGSPISWSTSTRPRAVRAADASPS